MVARFDSNKPRPVDDRHLPPHNIEAEEAVLGGILFDPNAIGRIASVLPPQAFYTTAHQHIYKAALDLHQQSRPTDLISVFSQLINQGVADVTGGQGRLVDLFDRCITAVNIDAYADLILEKYHRRCLIQSAQGMIADALNATLPWSEVQEAAEQRVFALSESKEMPQLEMIGDIMVRTFERIQSLESEGDVELVPSQFYDLDAMLGGGFRPGQLAIVGGRPAMGKTSFVSMIAVNVAEQQKPVAFFSLEMSKEQLGVRFLSGEASVDSLRLVGGNVTEEEWQRLGIAFGKFSALPLSVNDAQDMNPATILSQARQFKMRHGLSMIVVDYLHLMLDGRDEEVKALGRITRDCKKMARELEVPVVLLSQLSRAVEGQNNKRPSMKDLRQSGSIEQDADVILFLYRDEYYDPDTTDRGIAEVIIGKNRSGPTGTIKLLFEPQFTRFRNLAKEWT